MYIEQLYTNCLAEAAYYIESDGIAAVIDPIRETEPYLELARKRGARINFIFETHFHADFVSGHIDLAKKTGAKIIYGPMAETKYEVHNAFDGEIFSLGKLKIKALHTPGHTPESTCFLLFDETGKEHAVFTGDTLFVGDVGRPDLLDGKISREDLASMLYDSLNTKIKTLGDDVIVYPAHGPGSACGKNIGKETFSTIGDQKKFNYALKATSRQQFVSEVTEGIQPPPRYFFEDARINKDGYDSIDEVVKKNNRALRADQFAEAIQNGALILDTRNADDFEKGFVPGSINIGLNGSYAVWVGTLININQPMVLITDEGKEHESVLRLARVGYENVLGYLQGGVKSWKNSLDTIRSIQPEQMKAEISKGIEVIDVRKPSEWKIGHVKNASLLPLADMPKNYSHLAKSKPYLVHCGGGYRSMVAISLMKKDGFTNLTNIYGGFNSMQDAGLEIVREEEVVAS
ncbi:MAG: MBL-fold metallo-hydrolase superfamily [Cytophagales bacterium]|jgi:glyoxylase-like metal-dependent hydrolase (beta-lactamase superfamily II)/rhodanese-related sulfurtransferase|nr:MBL fold metallo-hydrolase [Bacteroidota bacterium]MBS1980025.1 MBL fold metallo-hydrolase [Bacteroidota bacterium]WHZ07225.1 MAG: MBL-fold metallo-hydrolase superfamily [Cytophagales bacterium]